MLATRQALRLSARPTMLSYSARRSYSEIPRTNKTADPGKAQNNTMVMAGLAGIGLAAVYFIFLSKPDVAGSVATGDPDKAKDPKMTRSR